MPDEAKRIGLMGGTFDPIHFGHLHCAERAREALGLDEVVFIPAGDPAFKQGRRIAPAQARLAMCQLAVADNPAFTASGIELAREGITFTVDTLEALHEELSGSAELFFIMGADSLELLESWKDPERLAQLAAFCCVARPGHEVDPSLVERLESAGFRIEVVDAPLLDISSSAIRQMCESGESIRYLTPFSVCALIEQHGLYRPAQ